MINLDDEPAQEYLLQSCEHTAAVKAGLLTTKDGRSQMDDELLADIYRAVHYVGGGGVFDLVRIRDLALQMEDVLALIRYRKMAPTPHRLLVLLRAADRLHELVQNAGASNQADIAVIMSDLARLSTGHQASIKNRGSAVETGSKGQRRLCSLLVEDDSVSQIVLQTFLSRYGECHVAANGRAAVESFRSALLGGHRYDLICMDIMMPEMDGREAVRRIRALEESRGILSTSRAKIIMTTAVTDSQEVIRCFRESCDAYLLKPIDLTRLLGHMKSYQLVLTNTVGP